MKSDPLSYQFLKTCRRLMVSSKGIPDLSKRLQESEVKLQASKSEARACWKLTQQEWNYDLMPFHVSEVDFL